MAKAPLICKKLSAGSSAEAIGRELDRRAHTYANEVDPSRTHLNLDYVRQQDGRMVPVPHAEAAAAGYERLEDAIERRIGELHTKRKIRSDAVKAEGMVISTEGALPDEDALAFLTEAIDWMQDRYGPKNLLAASIHFDEEVPHAQLWVAPVIHDEATGYDRLSAKELFTPNKVDKKTKQLVKEGTLGKLQRDFYEEVAAGYGFEKPFTADERFARGIAYKSQAAYKADQEARRTTAAARAEVAALEAEQAEREAELAEIKAEIRAEQSRLESVRRARVGLDSATGAAKLRAALADRVDEDEMRDAEQQLREARERNRQAREGRAAARGRVRDAEARRDGLRARLVWLRERAAMAARAVDVLLGRLVDRLGGHWAWGAPALVEDLAHERGCHTITSSTYEAWSARQVGRETATVRGISR